MLYGCCWHWYGGSLISRPCLYNIFGFLYRIWLLRQQLPLSHLKQEERKKKVHQQTYSYSPWPLITMTHGHIWPEDGIRQRGWGWVSDSTVSAHLTYTPKRGMVRSECNGFFLCPLLCIFTFLFSRTFSSQCHWQHTFIIHSPWSCPHSLNTNWVEHMCHLIIFPRIFHLYSLFCF